MEYIKVNGRFSSEQYVNSKHIIAILRDPENTDCAIIQTISGPIITEDLIGDVLRLLGVDE